MDISMFHIAYIPEEYHKGKNLKGNGGKQGCPAGHIIKPLNEVHSILHGNGCLRHGYKNCLACPRFEQGLDCDYNPAIETRLRKQLPLKEFTK